MEAHLNIEVRDEAENLYDKFYKIIWENVCFDDDYEVHEAAISSARFAAKRILEEVREDDFEKINFWTRVIAELNTSKYD